MKNTLCIALWSGLIALVAACQPTARPNASSSPDPDVIAGLVRVFAFTCMKEMEADDASEQPDFAEMLALNDMTPEKLCDCSGRTIFETMTQGDLDQYMRDSSRYENVSEHEPWKTRAFTAGVGCAVGIWPE